MSGPSIGVATWKGVAHNLSAAPALARSDGAGEAILESMKPMQPMKPMDLGPAWWPEDLGQPASSGRQNDIRYAFFPDHRRLAVEQDGKVTLYDSGDHRINGVSQEQSSGEPLAFASQHGEVRLEQLQRVE